ncbi:MAG TPA: hypothetical protein VEF37_02170 [Thermodesulfovibrionales bacterium]|nr:hypothetical protein [Thermodesulfovibrionales bacterium]
MKKIVVIQLFVFILFAVGLLGTINGEEPKKEEPFFNSSLHYTSRGMAYWYDKANGGIETLTGIPYSQLPCQHCHVSSCDTCHKTKTDERFAYSTGVARNQEICLGCHSREASILKIDKAAHQEDVHVAKGMQCMQCHTTREIHGDGMEYKSLKQSGAMDANCEKCHTSIAPSISHKVHREKLDCKACHVRHVVSCSNCHFDTLVKEGKKVAIPLSGWVFLMNHNGKVTSANMQTFVVAGDKTFLVFAPQNSHSIIKEGKKCDECHATETVRKVQEGKLSLIWLENGNVKNVKGVIPVVNGVIYDAVYQNYKDGKWIPIENPPSPVVHYAGFGEPLSKEQLKKLSIPMGKK